jgi:hypothetical protein
VAVLCGAGALAWHFIGGAVEVGWLVLVCGILAYTAVYVLVVILLASNDYERDLMRTLVGRFLPGK